jgi:hypothetical protein
MAGEAAHVAEWKKENPQASPKVPKQALSD